MLNSLLWPIKVNQLGTLLESISCFLWSNGHLIIHTKWDTSNSNNQGRTFWAREQMNTDPQAKMGEIKFCANQIKNFTTSIFISSKCSATKLLVILAQFFMKGSLQCRKKKNIENLKPFLASYTKQLPEESKTCKAMWKFWEITAACNYINFHSQ